MSYFLQSTEFFVIASVVAALIVGFMAKPRSRGEARQFFLELDVAEDDNADDPSSADPSVELTCRDDGSVIIVRRGLQGVTTSGMVNLAINIIGNDVTINERLVEGSSWSPQAHTAMGVMDMLGSDRYHIKYVSDATGRFAAFSLNNRPGFHTLRPLNN